MSETSRSHLLLVDLADDASGLELEHLPSFQCARVSGFSEALQRLGAESFDCVLIADARCTQVSEGDLLEVERACGENVTACVLGGRTRAGMLVERLAALSLDGFVDLGWPDSVIDAYLLSAIHRVQAGRNVVEVQRSVLRAAQAEMETLRLKEELATRTRELMEAQEQLFQSQKIAALTSLGAGIAHEINNPLASVLGLAQYLQVELVGREAPEEVKLSLRTIEREAKRISEIVGTLLRFTRGPKQRGFVELDMRRVLEESVGVLERSLAEQGIEVERRFEPDLPPVIGVATQLQQVFLHLLQNARTAMPEGGRITLSMENVDNQLLRIVVQDTGKGIEQENLKKIFEPFFTTKSDWRSTGLGLTVAYRILEEHHGTIKAESSVDKGTSMTLLLPVAGRGPRLV